MTLEPHCSPTLTILEDLTDAEWETEIAHTPHLAAQDAIWTGLDMAADGAAALPGGGMAND